MLELSALGSHLRIVAAVIGGIVLLAWLWALARARATGVPLGGRIVAVDERGDWKIPAKTYRSARLGLAGRPDFVTKGRGALIPIEVKPFRQGQPRQGDRLQLGAYLLLLEEATGKRPPYGILQYGTGTFRIANTRALRERVLETAGRIREKRAEGSGGRSHRSSARCRACGWRDVCRESLV